MLSRSIILLSLMSASLAVQAQHARPADTVMKGATIEVLQSYKPQVRQIPKPEWVPQLPAMDTTHPAFNYEVPQQTLYYTYHSLPLRPLALGKEEQPKAYHNYVMIGAGNLSTLFLDAGFAGISNDKYETALHLHSISQKGSISDQRSSLMGAEADGTLHNDFSDWHAGFMVERNQYYYYGYDHDLFNYPSSDIRQTYTLVRVTVDTKDAGDSTEKLHYNAGITPSVYTAAQNTTETTIGYNFPVRYQFDRSLDGLIALNGAFTGLKTNAASTSNNYAELLPGFAIHPGAFSGHALLGLALGAGNKQYLLPDVMASYHIPGSLYTASAGWQSTLRQNTYEQLTTENPYIYNTYPVMQMRKDELFADLAGHLGNYLSFEGRVSWLSFQGLPTYLNDTSVFSGANKQFYVVYDNVNAIATTLSARYKVANTWTAGASLDLYHYYNGSQQYAWQLPDMRLKGDFTAMPFNKLTVTAYALFMAGIHAQANTTGAVTSLTPLFDAGFNVEYQLIRQLSAFVQVNNLFDDKYQRWYGYQSYGLNVYGGVRFKL
jgi:hypothetical protein